MRRSTRAAARAGVLAAAALTALAIAPAHAADAGDGAGAGAGIAGYQSARQVLKTDKVKNTVSRFLAAAKPGGDAGTEDGGMGGGPEEQPAAADAAPRFDLKDPVPIYEISPEFVAGKAGGTPQEALQLTFLASRVNASDGHTASVLLTPKGGAKGAGGTSAGTEGWQLSGIRDGDEELAHAEGGTPQARTFAEPQIHAWYRLTDKGLVEPLNNEARSGLQGKGNLPLAEYQRLVHKRYGDKLPGSEYDRKGMAGGYAGLTDAGRTVQPKTAAPAPPDEAPKGSQSRAAAPTPSTGASWYPAAVAGAAGLTALGGALHRRRRRVATEH
ncbi:LPXTG cell wall anchor domain-containing protein [Streptomyces sp. NBRC 110611]|uniref:LPXTG cell wall anchor domain-containing protein n=1 Tax=Streptomyces sp. NBRC 110611 TaxID=1621259 RepID=UPI0011BE7F2C|nr:LPXTG cell wall anchor domain-containing protein [Streptomyces sp. NBRC 110611]